MGVDPYEDWRPRGKCASLSIEEADKLFFPERRNINQAKLFCASCPVRSLCLEFAKRTDSLGIWAGLSHKDRYAPRRSRAVIRRTVVVTFH